MKSLARAMKNKIYGLTGLFPAVFSFLLLCSFSVWAVDTESESSWEGQSQSFSSMPGLVVRVVFWLVLIAVLIWALVYLLKRLSFQRSDRSSPGSTIQVLDRALIAPKKAIYLVKIAGKVTALGVTDAQINMLTELPAEETLSVYTQNRPDLPFIQDLKRKLGLLGAKAKNVGTIAERKIKDKR